MKHYQFITFNLIALSFSIAAYAETASPKPIEITSFRETQVGSRVAEVCGVVNANVKFPAVVRIESDYKYANANYNAIVGPERTFCAVIVSLYGIVRVSIRDDAKKIEFNQSANL
jgi:hypothetical protein